MFGNLASALGSSGTALRAPPAVGTTNAPANPMPGARPGAMPFLNLPQQPPQAPLNQQQMQQGATNLGQPKSNPSVANSGQQNTIQQIMANLHPQATAALRAMPRDTMTRLTQAGLMHPGVMQHLYGNNNGPT